MFDCSHELSHLAALFQVESPLVMEAVLGEIPFSVTDDKVSIVELQVHTISSLSLTLQSSPGNSHTMVAKATGLQTLSAPKQVLFVTVLVTAHHRLYIDIYFYLTHTFVHNDVQVSQKAHYRRVDMESTDMESSIKSIQGAWSDIGLVEMFPEQIGHEGFLEGGWRGNLMTGCGSVAHSTVIEPYMWNICTHSLNMVLIFTFIYLAHVQHSAEESFGP